MKILILAFNFISLIFFFNVRVEAAMNLSHSDTIRIDQELVQGDSNYTALNYSNGIYPIGDTIIDLSQFQIHQKQIKLIDLSFDKKFKAIAEINTRGSRGFGGDYSEDTVMIKGQSKQLGKSIAVNEGEMPYQEKSFRNNCPPSVCGYYYVASVSKRNRVEVRGPSDLNKLIPKLITPADAFFFIDDRIYQTGKFKKLNDGYLILVNKVVNDCRVTYADLLYRVSDTGVVTYLGQNITQVTRMCY
jgi:hypothetical protein